MKHLLFLTFLLSIFFCDAQNPQTDADKTELKSQLDEREAKFHSYSVSLEKHSGIFGGKTKNDLRQSNQVLVDIVKLDNRIISTLYRVVDFRNFEKVNMSYDKQRNDELLNNLRHASDTLAKQVEVLKASNHAIQSKTTGLKWMLYTLLFLCIYLVVKLRRKNAVKPVN